VDLRIIPKTDALLDQKIASLSPEKAWWLDILKSGCLPYAIDPNRCPGKALYAHYARHAQTTGVRRRQIETAIGIFLRDVVRDPKTSKILLKSKIDTYERPDGLGGRKSMRGTVYTFPDLEVCRQRFAGLLQQAVDWGDPTEWEGWSIYDEDEALTF
jgi:hypothetical protein